MDNLTKDWLAGVLKKYENRPQDSHRWAPVESVNEDGSYQVRLNGSSVSTRCSPGCIAEAGDVVLVLITADGKCVAVSRLGGEIGGGGAATTAVVLYDNPEGSYGPITLADSAENYSAMDIFYKTNDGEHQSVRVAEPNGREVTLSQIKPRSLDAFYIKAMNVRIDGDTIAQDTATTISAEYNVFKGGTMGFYERHNILVTKVVGYTSLPNEGLPSGGGVTVETDPTVPAWAKQPNPPTYTAEDVGALPASTKIPTKVSELKNDAGYLTEIDKGEIIDAVLAAIPNANGVGF